MKRTIRLFFIITLSLLLSSCDAFVSLSGAMGRNIIGFNREEADLIVDSLTVECEAESEEMEGKGVGGLDFKKGKRFFYTDSEGESREFITLGTGTEGYSVIAWGEWAVRVSTESIVNLSEVEDLLLPSDLTILGALLSSSASDYVLSRLSQKVEDEKTLKAAEGTIKLYDALFEFLNTVVFPFIPGGKADALLEYTKDLKEKIERKSDITWGDVVVLDVMVNLCSRTPKEIITFLKDGEKTEEEAENVSSLLSSLLDDMYDFLFESVEILNRVSGTTALFSGTSISKFIAACFVK